MMKPIIERLTDRSLQRDPVMRAVVERGRDVIRQMGWERASVAERYNVLFSLGHAENGGQNGQ